MQYCICIEYLFRLVYRMPFVLYLYCVGGLSLSRVLDALLCPV